MMTLNCNIFLWSAASWREQPLTASPVLLPGQMDQVLGACGAT